VGVSREDTVREGNIVYRLIGLITCNEGVMTLVVDLIVAGVQIERMGSVNIAGESSQDQTSNTMQGGKIFGNEAYSSIGSPISDA
jgi:hypothetical protein